MIVASMISFKLIVGERSKFSFKDTDRTGIELSVN